MLLIRDPLTFLKVKVNLINTRNFTVYWIHVPAASVGNIIPILHNPLFKLTLDLKVDLVCLSPQGHNLNRMRMASHHITVSMYSNNANQFMFWAEIWTHYCIFGDCLCSDSIIDLVDANRARKLKHDPELSRPRWCYILRLWLLYTWGIQPRKEILHVR